ncbi:MAG: hypothetical protein AVDCRST_MAG64-954, partial [uncultured Phycisphaerae bacterium]
MSRAAPRVGGRRTRAKPASGAGPRNKSTAVATGAGGSGYLTESERPWAALAFLLPMVLVYEAYAFGWIGQPTAGTGGHVQNIIAFLLIDQFFALLGAAGRHLPALALMAMLLGAHLVRKDRWDLRLSTLAGMTAESVAWSVPLIVFGWVLARVIPLAGG